jgi:hypothetical protein
MAAAAGGLVVALLIADRLVLWKRSRWLLHLPDEGVQIPWPWDPSKKLSLGPRLIRSLKYRPRVLDAWVAEHHGTIEKRFHAIATVEQRRHHLSLPVKVGQKLEPELTPERLQALGGVGGLVLISGEGGVGKMSLTRDHGFALGDRLVQGLYDLLRGLVAARCSAAQLLRGGSWFNEPHNGRAANRNSNHPGNINTNNGVRPCCLLPPAPFTV